MLPLKSEPKKETAHQAVKERKTLNGKKRESQNLRDIYMIFALFILIGFVNWQSDSNYSTVNRANWLLKQSDKLECMQKQGRINVKKILNIQSFSCQ